MFGSFCYFRALTRRCRFNITLWNISSDVHNSFVLIDILGSVYNLLETLQRRRVRTRLDDSNFIYAWAELALILEYPDRFCLFWHMLGLAAVVDGLCGLRR